MDSPRAIASVPDESNINGGGHRNAKPVLPAVRGIENTFHVVAIGVPVKEVAVNSERV